MDEVKRYEFTYTNSFKDKYSADRELDPDGEYVLHTDYAKLEAERDAWKRYAEARENTNLEWDDESSFNWSWCVAHEDAKREVQSAKQALRDLGVME